MEIKTDQLTQLLRDQIEKHDVSVNISEVGEVPSRGRRALPGLENVMSSELVELPNGVFGMALTLKKIMLALYYLENLD